MSLLSKKLVCRSLLVGDVVISVVEMILVNQEL